jgi:hypothetical protein
MYDKYLRTDVILFIKLSCVMVPYPFYPDFTEQGARRQGFKVLKVCYFVSPDTLHLYVLSGNIDQVEHHKFIINIY